jgi:hypothetical protein
VSQVAIISVPSQRKLVNLLFFWEEELMRWRLLGEEEEEIRTAMGSGKGVDDSADLEMALKGVEARRKMLPSMRKEDGGGREGGELPGYEE